MSFQAALEKVGQGPLWVVARLPFDPAAAWPKHKGKRVKGTIQPIAKPAAKSPASPPREPFAFNTALMSSNELGHFLIVSAKMRKAASVDPGASVEFVLEPDTGEDAAAPPPELAKLLRTDRSAKKWFESMSYSNRKAVAAEIAEPKSAEVRLRRAELWMERIMQVMEGEESPPPVLQAAFRRQPLAREGWNRMTPNQRRMNLWGIVYCQSPEAQTKRVEKAVAEALKKVERA